MLHLTLIQAAERPDQQQDRDRNSKEPEQSVSTHFSLLILTRSSLSAGKSVPCDKVPSRKAKEFHRPWNSVERLIVKKRKIAA
jgi:hypothetical protein